MSFFPSSDGGSSDGRTTTATTSNASSNKSPWPLSVLLYLLHVKLVSHLSLPEA
jgi:hypothetical protein